MALSGPASRLGLDRLHARAPRVGEAAGRLVSIWPAHVNAEEVAT